MPSLAYVYYDEAQRDARLTALIQRFQGDISYWKYHDPEQLYQRIRDDVEAVIAQRIHAVETLESFLRIDANSTIAAILPIGKGYIDRPKLAREILDELSKHHIIQIYGEPGIGKTTLLAEIAKNNNFIFVSGSQLVERELATVIANKIVATTGGTKVYFTDFPSAYNDLIRQWQQAKEFTIVVDDCRDLG